MAKFGRTPFIAFGLLPAVNALGLMLYGLQISTGSVGGAAILLPALIVLLIIVLITAMVATVKRGHDIGWPGWMTVVVFWFALGTGPFFLLLIGYFIFAKVEPGHDDLPVPVSWQSWAVAALNLLWPWVLLGLLSEIH